MNAEAERVLAHVDASAIVSLASDLIRIPSFIRVGHRISLCALKCVVCAVSACPMDLTAANGWRITDLRLTVQD